jgi:hypothetical protein
VVGLLVAVALAALPFARERGREVSELAGVLAGVVAAVYGVFLAFAIVALYEQFHEASEDVDQESATLARVVRNAEALAPPDAARVRAAVRAYRDAVVGPEWRAMEDGEYSAAAAQRLDGVYAALRAAEPRGTSQTAFHAEAVTALNELVVARRARLHAAGSSLPGVLVVLLIGGALLTLGFVLLQAVDDRRMHAAMAVAVAALLGFCLVVTLVLDHPFSGDVSVERAPYSEGALAEL